MLEVDLDNPAGGEGGARTKASTNGQLAPGGESVRLGDYPEVLTALGVRTVSVDGLPDRSVDAYRVLCACYDAGLTQDRSEWVLRRREDLAEWLDENPANELDKTWQKITESRQQQAEEPVDRGQDDCCAERIVDGATFIFSAPETIPAIWGRNDEVLWSEGESLMIAGTLGLGKTTLAGLLVRALLFGGEVLGFPVVPVGEPILYLAMDRPRQIARSMRRQFRGEHEQRLSERLVVWEGPPREDMAKDPELLRELARKAGARHVFVDSLKDAAIKLSDDEVGAAYNRARQLLITDGCQLCELHHLVKRAPGDSVDDIYGSRWLTAGAGSLILLCGEPGDPIIKFKHVRSPAAEVGPFQLLSVQETGEISIYSSVDLIELAKAASESGGLTAKTAARALFEKDEPTRAEIEKARRRLVKLIAERKLRQEEGHRGGQVGDGEAKWLPA